MTALICLGFGSVIVGLVGLGAAMVMREDVRALERDRGGLF